jgi:hypothetical protein
MMILTDIENENDDHDYLVEERNYLDSLDTNTNN